MIDVCCFSAKGERGGSDGEEDLEEITDSAEESEENEEHAPPPVTTAQVTTPTPSVRHTGRPGVLMKYCYLVCSKLNGSVRKKRDNRHKTKLSWSMDLVQHWPSLKKIN